MDAKDTFHQIRIKQQSILAALAKLQNLTEDDVTLAITNEVDTADVLRELTNIDQEIWNMVDFFFDS